MELLHSRLPTDEATKSMYDDRYRYDSQMIADLYLSSIWNRSPEFSFFTITIIFGNVKKKKKQQQREKKEHHG